MILRCFLLKTCVILNFTAEFLKASDTGTGTTLPTVLWTSKSSNLTLTHVKIRCVDLDEATIVGNKTIQMKCCKYAYNSFVRKWRNSKARLGEWLNYLKIWQCPQFQEECDSPTFSYTAFNTYTYSRFCTPSIFKAKCGNGTTTATEISTNTTNIAAIENSGYIAQENHEYTERDTVKRQHFLRNLSTEELLDPCVQASLFETEKSSQSYFEPKIIDLPFCEIVWCAFPTEVFITQHISFSVCMSHGCRQNLHILMIVFGAMCVAIAFTNISVLLVLTLKNRSMNSQKVYKMSLAVADLLVGLVVLPTVIESIRKNLMFRHEIVTEIDKNGTSREGITTLNYSYVFFGIAGFCTTLSLLVSIYTLMVASFDRLLVVYRPLEYNKFRATHTAKILVGSIWITAVLFSALPFIIPELGYAFVASVVVLLAGKDAVILYCVVIAVPLLIVWVTNIATLIFYRHNTQKSGLPSSNVDLQTTKSENELLKTLAVMVGVFTACMLPLVIITISQLSMPDIFLDDPKVLNESKASVMISCEAVAVIILMSNSLWNFFIYNGRSPEFRAGFKSLLQEFLRGPIRCLFNKHISEERQRKHNGNPTLTDRSLSTTYHETRIKPHADDEVAK